MGLWGELFTGNGGSNPSVSERLTEASRRAIQYARLEAVHRGETVIAAADLLAGLSVEEDTRAERVGSLKSNAFYLRWLTGLPALPSRDTEKSGATETDLIGFDAESKRAFAFAVLEADRDREYWVDSDHLLRGLLRFPNKANFAILKTEIDLDAARAASKQDREDFPPQQSSNVKVVKYLVRKYVLLLVPPILSLVCYLYILLQGFGLTASPLAR
jgi:ATP-dependent Clp protease ATP-binding subunit ClpA